MDFDHEFSSANSLDLTNIECSQQNHHERVGNSTNQNLITLWQTNISIQNSHLWLIYLVNNVMFHSCVGLPEGNILCLFLYILCMCWIQITYFHCTKIRVQPYTKHTDDTQDFMNTT